MKASLKWLLLLAVIALTWGLARSTPAPNSVTLLNVSYDPTRELYEAFNAAFSA